MPTKRNDRRPDAFDLLRGGKAVPESFIRRRMADVKSSLTARYKEISAIRQQATNYSRQIQGPAAAGKSPQAQDALAGLFGIHTKLANRKIKAPGVPGEAGGILAGRFAAKVTPPFDYAYAIPFPNYGNTSLTGSADKSTGQLNCSAITDPQNPSFGSMYAEMGIYLHPMFGPATLTLSATPSFCMEWWTNSLGSGSAVRSFGEGSMGIYCTTGEIGPTVGNLADFIGWDEQMTGQVLFDFGCNHVPTSVQVQVDPSLQCALFIAMTAHIEGVGWPGSLAGSVLSGTLPSITYELDLIPEAVEA